MIIKCYTTAGISKRFAFCITSVCKRIVEIDGYDHIHKRPTHSTAGSDSAGTFSETSGASCEANVKA